MAARTNYRWNKPGYDPGGGNVLTYGVSVRFIGPIWNRGAVPERIKKATKKTLEYGKNIIQAATPVDTDVLRPGWRYLTADKKIYNEVPYSIFVEYGTYKMAPRHMARNNLQAIGDRYVTEIETALKELY